MARKTNESARILNFFAEASLDKAETIYDLVRDVMQKRLAPRKAEKKAKRAPKAAKAAAESKPHVADRGNGGVSADA